MNSDFMLTSPLLTDFYQLTMAYGYFKEGIAEEESCFHLAFRKHPFKGGFTIAAGLENAVKYIRDYHFSENELVYLSSLRDDNNKAYFSQSFIDYLKNLRMTIDLDAVLEGSPVFPLQPLLRVRGPLLQCQLLETALLNIINFQTLIATKAARICLAAGDSKIIDFGLRRAQGFDGALSASRAAFIGGVQATSNVLAGFKFGIPVSGTMAHSFVMRFAHEKDAFMAFAKAMPSNSILLTDTYNSLDGVKNAIEVGHWLRSLGHNLAGIRLDSGDLVSLSKKSRRALDDAGFKKSIIVASNELDEYSILELKQKNAPIDAFGVGTRLVTAFDEPALGGVFKLSAVRPKGQAWEYRIKLSDDHAKATLPGILQVKRFEHKGHFVGDIIFDELKNDNLSTVFESDKENNLLKKIIIRGVLYYKLPSLSSIQEYALEELRKMPKECLSLSDPESYPVIISNALMARREIMSKAKH